ncbi:glucose-6-phosphate dehydrogenase [Actinomadura barringtoniae]|uniref:Glucose-6-phosphate 1-dehydrogenase n=2 Tax=Actinomadura barringtoniae TaxID=1427535 RepID=A0A939T3K1_9ACTN|nr:glucose-6-phosphate dehydrogenase [Actinomadura barringtoniae]
MSASAGAGSGDGKGKGGGPKADALVLFGITGDLAKKMLLPALYRLTARGELNVPVIGVAKSDWDDEALRSHAREAIADVYEVDDEVFGRLADKLSIETGDYTDGATFSRLRDRVRDHGFLSHYLAIPPSLFATVAEGLAGVGLNENARLVVEKPFGHNLASARALNAELQKYFDEDHLLRVDHFLGSEPVDGLMIARFANTLLEPLWNRSYIDNVQISLSEDFDVADRGSFYDSVGALRDVVQNHLLQVLAYLIMEPPSSPDAQAWLNEKQRALSAVRAIDPADVVRGQYEGYLGVEGVKPGSTTETFIALKLLIDNWRWAGVPFYIRSGKCMSVSSTEVIVELRRPPVTLFKTAEGEAPPNLLRFRMEPKAGMTFDLLVEQPGNEDKPVPVPLSVDFSTVLGPGEMPYEHILSGAISGNPELFTRFDLVEESWRIVEPILDPPETPEPYAVGTDGPAPAETLPGSNGWHVLEGVRER